MYPAPRTTSRPAAARTNIRTRSRCWSRTVGARCLVFNSCDDAPLAEAFDPADDYGRAHKATAHAGDGPARAVEVASQLLPQLHGVFVCVVAPRHRVRDADLAAELAAALRAALPAATRVGAPRCMWLLANAKLERTLLCRVNLKS